MRLYRHSPDGLFASESLVGHLRDTASALSPFTCR